MLPVHGAEEARDRLEQLDTDMHPEGEVAVSVVLLAAVIAAEDEALRPARRRPK